MELIFSCPSFGNIKVSF
jgi:hypothetical protein